MSLTTVSVNARKTVRYTIYGLIAIFILRLALIQSIKIFRFIFPKPPPAPTVLFGRVTPISFPKIKDVPKFNFVIETADSDLPKFPTQMPIYFVPKASVSLSSVTAGKEKARRMGFASDAPKEFSDVVLRFQHLSKPSTLELNVIKNIFSISYDLNIDPTPLSKQPPIPIEASNIVKEFLSTNGFLPDDLRDGEYTHEFLTVENNRLTTAISLSESKLIQINLFRKPINEYPFVTSYYKRSNVWFYVSGFEKNVIAGEYIYFPIDEEQSSTYPIKTAEQALEDLKNSKAYFANLGGNKEGDVIIRRIYLAYFDPKSASDQFMQPVIVFEGDQNFVAYVPAVSDEFYGE